MFCLLPCIMLSCSKDEPEGGSDNGGGSGGSSGSQLTEATINLSISLPERRLAGMSELQSSHAHRFIAELHTADRSVVHRTVLTQPIEDFKQATATIKTSILPGSYVVAVWSDYVRKNRPTENLHYNSESLIPVKAEGDYVGCLETKECFFGTKSLTLASGSRATLTANAEITLQQPVGRVEFIATDFDLFRRRYKAEIAGGAPFSVKITYPQYIATGFNVHDDVLKEQKGGISFLSPLDTSKLGDRILLAFDYLFAEADGSEIPVVIEILMGQECIAKSSVKFPVRRGENTVVSAAFLTSTQSGGGVTIDTGYDGVVNIDLGKI